MITKPLIWSTILEFHEISVLATACDVKTSHDIPVEVSAMYDSKTESFIKNGKPILRKGKHMQQKYVISTDTLKQWNFSVTKLVA
jgi:hypothetical protein